MKIVIVCKGRFQTCPYGLFIIYYTTSYPTASIAYTTESLRIIHTTSTDMKIQESNLKCLKVNISMVP